VHGENHTPPHNPTGPGSLSVLSDSLEKGAKRGSERPDIKRTQEQL